MRMHSSFVAHPFEGHTRRPAAGFKHVLLQFLELQVPMALGALVCLVVLRLLPPALAAIYHPGTYLFAVADTLFLTVPVIVWMVLRGHDAQQCVRILICMLAPLGLIFALGQLAGLAYLEWLTVAGYPALSLGMLAYLLTAHPAGGEGGMVRWCKQSSVRIRNQR